MKKYWTILLTGLLVSTLVFSATGCQNSSNTTASSSASGAAKEGGSIVVGVTTEPGSLDPFTITSADTRSLLFNVFEGLVKPDKNGNLIPAVAAKLPDVSSDGLTYTFKIREGIQFQNGNKVTAGDVKYSLETAKSKQVEGLSNLQSVDAVDDSTVKLTLTKRDNSFLAYLTTPIVPKDYGDQSKHPIGTGPYQFVSYTPQQSVVLQKNKTYWQKGLPHLDKVTYKIEADTNALVLDLKSGSVDVAGADYATANQVGSGFTTEQSNSNAVQLLALNNAVKPLDNVKVRQALSYAVDPDEIIKTVNYGKGTRVGTPVIPGFKKYYDSSLAKAYPKNVSKAKQLLSEAGYPNGFSLTITVPSVYQVHVDTAQVIVNELKTIGVTATIKQVDWATWLSQVYTNRQYESTIISVDGTSLTPESYLSRYVSTSKSNFFNYKDTEYDTLYQQAVEETDDTKRVQLFKQVQELISKDAANVYIQDIASFHVLKNGVTGFTPYPLYVLDLSTLYETKS